MCMFRDAVIILDSETTCQEVKTFPIQEGIFLQVSDGDNQGDQRMQSPVVR